MRLKTQFVMTTVFSAVFLVVVGLLILVMNQLAQSVVDQAEIAEGVSIGASELSYLSGAYLVHSETRQIQRWRLSFATFLELIHSLNVNQPEDRMLVKSLTENGARLKEIFEETVSGGVGLTGEYFHVERFRISWSRLAIQSQSIISEASRLAQLLRVRADSLATARNVFLYVFLIFLGAFILFNFARTYMRVVRSFGVLRAGAKVIGEGNLDFVIPETKEDEIGEVAEEFNRMVEARKRAEIALASERKRFFDVLESLPVLVCLLTTDYHVAFANKAFRDTFGESKGRHCYEYCFDRNEPCEFCESFTVLETGKPHKWEAKIEKTRSIIEAHDFLFTDIDGSRLTLEMDIDITEQRRMQAALLDAHSAIAKEKRLSDIGTLAATVAHELRNPLAAIRLAVYNVKRKANNLEIDKHLSSIDKKVAESDQIINNLLFYTRLKPPHFEMTNIFDILDESAELIAARFGDAIGVTRDFESLKGLVIEADPVQMREVFLNILNNSQDAVSGNGSKGTISIQAEKPGDSITVTIRDNGHGIKKDEISRVFDPFFTTKAKGTGLGLSVCEQLIKLHDGTIRIESEARQGTAVIVSLPVLRKTAGQSDIESK
jgi:signal transduction histidine kinase/HAMP domain-containing protein